MHIYVLPNYFVAVYSIPLQFPFFELWKVNTTSMEFQFSIHGTITDSKIGSSAIGLSNKKYWGLWLAYVSLMLATLNTRTTSVEFLNSQFTVQFQLLQIVGSICKQSDCETRNNGAYDWLMSHPRTTEKKAEYSILTKNLTSPSILYVWRLLIINTFCWWWLQSTVRWWRWRLVYHTKLGTEKDEKKNSAYKAASFLDMTAIYGRLRFKTQNNIDAFWERR